MNITAKIIITDTNIITDLNHAKILEQFANLNHVYISDLIKHDEMKSDTGDTNVIGKFKVINATPKELAEISNVRLEKPKLSIYDALNFIIARDNKAILATGDKDLKTYSENHGVKVIRTLKIILLMFENGIISREKAMNACRLLYAHPRTRIPKEDIKNLIEKLEKDSVSI